MSEHFTWDDSGARRELSFALGQEDNKLRVMLPRQKWEAIADPVKAEFNQRLRQMGLKSGQWAVKAVRYALTENPVSDYRPETIELPLFKLGEDEAVWTQTTASTMNGGRSK